MNQFIVLNDSPPRRKPDIILKMSGDTWAKLYVSERTAADMIKSGEINVATGKATDVVRLLDSFDRYDPAKAVVVPRASLV
jgi:hypothetical protein